MKRFSTSYALRAGGIFGALMALTLGAANGIGGLFAGLVMGTVLGLIVFAMIRSKERVWAQLREPYVSEGIVHEGPASCSIGQGYMVLTEKRLAWLPMATHDREKLIRIAREAIVKVDRGGMSSNLKVTVHTGESVEFLVRGRKAWLRQLHVTKVTLPTARVV